MKTEVIYLMNKDGVVDIYQNKAEAFTKLGYNFIVYSLALEIAAPESDDFWKAFRNRQIARKKNVKLGKTYGELYKQLNGYGEIKVFGDFVLRNEYNEKLSALDFAQFIFKAKKEFTYTPYGQKFWNGEGPVPLTGKLGRYCYRRRPKTLNIIKDALSGRDEDEIEFNVINRRAKRRITTSWDDRGRSDWRDRSWKRHRKTQYK